MNKWVKRGVFAAVVLVVAGMIFIPRLGMLSLKEGGEALSGSKSASELPVKGMVAEKMRSVGGYHIVGTLLPNEEVELVAEIVGKVKKVYFEDGTRVTRGELLLKVEDDDLQAQLSRSEFQRKLLSEKLERQRILLQRESISREQFDQLQTDYNMLEADILLLKVKIGRTEIRAPFDGITGFRYVSEGSYVQPSSKITTIVDNSSLKLSFSLPARYATYNLPGKRVDFTPEVGGKYTAWVYAVDPMLDPDVKMITLRARYDNSNGKLMAGMYTEGTLVLDGDEEYISIPTEAVVPEMNGQKLWVAKNGRAVSVPVEIENRDERNVNITTGIQPGDTVLINGLMQLREGMQVKVSL
ncbi:MAG: efflux RND transporter periplasmic adaptor subunit [Culturomica sp.]|jgi:membrane fusion protein (multidrug efflux system)|nr:efflux RND transporter periplasmic adaptor subunit [Culturomica sp.]